MSKLNKKLVFNKYRVKKLIATTPFGWIYEGVNEKSNEPIAMKFENIGGKYNLLESEAYYLFNLKGFGIPKIITYGKTGYFNCLIEELLGLTLEKVWNLKKIKLNYKLKYICMLALQIIDRLEYIHSKNIIHRDIKTNNLVIGRNDPEIIYLIDFGLARKYKSSRTGKHIKFNNLKKSIGNLRYISINGNRGYEQSRRDDLESLGYMLIYLSKNSLPWVNPEILKIKNKIKKYEITLKLKQSIKPEKLCAGLPIEFIKYINYCRNLEFEQDPNYNYLRNLFTTILTRNKQKNDLNFFWINNKKRKCSIDGKSADNRYNFFRKRESSQKRLYNQIKKSLEKAKSQDLSKMVNFNFMKIKVEKENISCKKPINKKNDSLIKNNIPKKIIFDNYNIKNDKDIISDNKDINKEEDKKINITNITNIKNENINSNNFFKRYASKIVYKINKRNSNNNNNNNNMNNRIKRKINLEIKSECLDHYTNNMLKMNMKTAYNSYNNISKDILSLNTNIDGSLQMREYKNTYRTLEERKKEKSKNRNNSNINNITINIDKFNNIHSYSTKNYNNSINNNNSMQINNTNINKNNNNINSNINNNINNKINSYRSIYKINRNKDKNYFRIIKCLKSGINFNEENNKSVRNNKKLSFKINRSNPLLNIQNHLDNKFKIKKITPIITMTSNNDIKNAKENHKKVNSVLNQYKLKANKKAINSSNTNNIYILPNVSLNLIGIEKNNSKFKSYNDCNLNIYD